MKSTGRDGNQIPEIVLLPFERRRKRGQNQNEYRNATVQPLLVVPLEIAANTFVKDTHPVPKNMSRVSCMNAIFGFGVETRRRR